MSTIGIEFLIACKCARDTVDPYIGGDINMTIEAEVHTLINKNLQKLSGTYSFSAETIFDYDTEQLVTTINAKSPGGTPIKKPVQIRHSKLAREEIYEPNS